MRYYGVKLVNQGSQVQSSASPVYQMRPEAVASSAWPADDGTLNSNTHILWQVILTSF